MVAIFCQKNILQEQEVFGRYIHNFYLKCIQIFKFRLQIKTQLTSVVANVDVIIVTQILPWLNSPLSVGLLKI